MAAAQGVGLQLQQPMPFPLLLQAHREHMALDDATFGYCSTFCVAFPSAFLWLEPFKALFAGLVSEKRPMDNMARL